MIIVLTRPPKQEQTDILNDLLTIKWSLDMITQMGKPHWRLTIRDTTLDNRTKNQIIEVLSDLIPDFEQNKLRQRSVQKF
jgi:hypothetical protein